MTPVAEGDILDAAMVFRAALDVVDADIWLAATIDQFPAGACGHASELLGRYLRDTLAIECAYVLKDLMNPDGSWRSGHAWLDFDGLIIDITGDQFGWAPVIVTRVSRVHEEADAQLHQPLTNDVRWWGIYCAPILRSGAAMDRSIAAKGRCAELIGSGA
jgi:hypothetical protein